MLYYLMNFFNYKFLNLINSYKNKIIKIIEDSIIIKIINIKKELKVFYKSKTMILSLKSFKKI